MERYVLIDHTADMMVKAFGKTLEECFGNAAYAMFDQTVDLSNVGTGVVREIRVEGMDDEDRLYSFLSEMLYIEDAEGLVLKEFDVSFEGDAVLCTTRGEMLDRSKHRVRSEIKAVTYHMMKVDREEPSVTVLFDMRFSIGAWIFYKSPNGLLTNHRTVCSQITERFAHKSPNNNLIRQKYILSQMKKYLPRIADDILSFKLSTKGAVWIRGPKWVGKSTTAKQFANSCKFMQDEDTKDQNIHLAKMSPSTFLNEKPPLLIDEWQTIPFIWNQIRMEVDRRDEFGQFILTGSIQPDSEEMQKLHSGVGRISEMLMRPMTLYESRESNGSTSIERISKGGSPSPSVCEADIHDYAFYTARGGWPKAIDQPRTVALQQAIDYYEGIISADISVPGNVSRDRERTRLVLRSYARNCGTQAKITVIRDDISANDGLPPDEDTIRSYLNALKMLYVIEDSKSWNPNLRSKTAIRTSDTRYFVDPSIGCAALGIGPEGLIADLRTFGFLFENLCIRDLRVYSERVGGTVQHFRTSSGLECDAVVTFRDGGWIAAEIKLGGQDYIDEGAANLRKMVEMLDPGMRKPILLMVITATNAAYERDDGVWVVPLGCLGP